MAEEEVVEVVVGVVAEVVVEGAEVVVGVAEEEVVVVELAELRKNNADPDPNRQSLADRWYPTLHPRSEETWLNHQNCSNEPGPCRRRTDLPRSHKCR